MKTLFASLLLLFVVQAAPGAEGDEYFEYEVLPGVDGGLAGAFAGADSDGDLLVAGGVTDVVGGPAATADVQVLLADKGSWSPAGQLAAPAAFGASARSALGLFCVGGEGPGGVSSTDAFLLEWTDGVLVQTALPPLPAALQGVSAGALDAQLYVYGVTADGEPALYVLDASVPDAEWRPGPAPSGEPVLRPALVGFGAAVYLLGGVDSSGEPASGSAVLDLRSQEWKPIAPAPMPLGEVLAATCGEAHLTVFGADPADPLAILAYHTVTNTWAPTGKLPSDPGLLAVDSLGLEMDLIGVETSIRATARLIPTKYGWLDHGIVALYMGGMLLIGGVLARREKGTSDFFRGGRRVPWWASGLSMFATAASAISLMAMPGKSYSGDWTYFMMSVYAVMVLPLAMYVYAPVVRRLDVSTANEYLERRFNLPTRLFGAIIYSLNQMLGRMATIMLLPAIALSTIVGIPLEYSILIMGLVTTIYVTAGGLEAVIWTDVVQALIMVGSVVLCIIWALFLLTGEPSATFQAISDANKLRLLDWDLDLTQATAFAMFLNVVGSTTGMLGDQNFIQRVQCTATEKLAKKAVATQIAVAVPLNVILFSLGTVLFLFFRENPGQLNPAIKSDGIFPLFAAQELPAGVAGLVVAALLAATMSTLSSAVNSTSNLGVEDFYRRLVPKASDHQCLVLGRWLSIILGVLGTGAALLLAKTGLDSVWDLAILVMGMISGPIVGIFGLGIFTKRANGFGVLVGSIACVIVTILLRFQTDVNPFLYLPFGFFVCFVVGYAASHLVSTPSEKVDGLTAYDLLGKHARKEEES